MRRRRVSEISVLQLLACVDPGSPFFPSAYHEGPASLSLGLQGASIIADAFLAQKETPSLLLLN